MQQLFFKYFLVQTYVKFIKRIECLEALLQRESNENTYRRKPSFRSSSAVMNIKRILDKDVFCTEDCFNANNLMIGNVLLMKSRKKFNFKASSTLKASALDFSYHSLSCSRTDSLWSHRKHSVIDFWRKKFKPFATIIFLPFMLPDQNNLDVFKLKVPTMTRVDDISFPPSILLGFYFKIDFIGWLLTFLPKKCLNEYRSKENSTLEKRTEKNFFLLNLSRTYFMTIFKSI